MYFIVLHHLVAVRTRSDSVVTRCVYRRLSASRVYMRAVVLIHDTVEPVL